MKRVIFECVGNSILFILTGLILIYPCSDYQNNANEFYFTTGIFLYSDEREKIIVAESTKIAYQVLLFGLIFTMALLAGIRFCSLTILQSMEINIYAVSIGLVTLNLVFAMISYCVKWCVEYKRLCKLKYDIDNNHCIQYYVHVKLNRKGDGSPACPMS